MSDTKVAKLTPNQVEMALKDRPQWKINSNGEIERTVVSSGFPQSILFSNAVALLAESQNHHPDILIQWNKVKFCLITHDADGLTQKDFDLAGQIDDLPILSAE